MGLGRREGGCSGGKVFFGGGLLAACSDFEESLAQEAVGTFHLVLTLGDSCVVQLLAHYELLRAGGLPHGAILAVHAQTCARFFLLRRSSCLSGWGCRERMWICVRIDRTMAVRLV